MRSALVVAVACAAATMAAADEAAAAASVGVAVIACGRLASEALFGMCVASIRGAGAYDGPIYALTDAPRCAPRGVVVVPVEVAAGCEDNGSLLYKQLKMRLLDVAATADRPVVLYLDVDVIAGAPLRPLLAFAARALDDSGASIAAYVRRSL